MEKILANALGQDATKVVAQEKSLLLSRLLARFAHEVRNPLSSLDIHVQLLEEDLQATSQEVREKAAGRLDIIHGEIRRLESIVKHFLSLAGPSALDLRLIDIKKVIFHVCDLLRPEAADRNIDIQTVVPESLPMLEADSAQLTQALVNLVINAIQAVERKGLVEVGAELNELGGELILKVRDTGPGILPESRSSIFEPFFTTKSEGSGLGLWIVQQIVAAHNGTVDVSNAATGGAIFALHLPLRKKPYEHG